MKNKTIIPLIILLLALLLGGAGMLYNKLGQRLASDRLEIQQPKAGASGEETPEEAASEEATSEEATSEEAAGSEQTPEEQAPEEEAEPEMTLAPDFTVYDGDGNEVHLSDYVGKPVVLNFWASWCGPCQGEMPDFHEKYLELGEDVQFLLVNMTDGQRETVDTASAFIDEKGYTFPVFYDKDSNAARTYSVYSIPATYFIDAQGYAIAQATGAIDGETLQRGINLITGE